MFLIYMYIIIVYFIYTFNNILDILFFIIYVSQTLEKNIDHPLKNILSK